MKIGNIVSARATHDAADFISVGAILGTLFDWLPAVAAFLGAVWTAIRIYEWARVVVFNKPPRTFSLKE